MSIKKYDEFGVEENFAGAAIGHLFRTKSRSKEQHKDIDEMLESFLDSKEYETVAEAFSDKLLELFNEKLKEFEIDKQEFNRYMETRFIDKLKGHPADVILDKAVFAEIYSRLE